ncbi:MAG: xanthine dehydrogenase family protein subunit M [Candidatus Tectomicrobia bacterium]|nr:xanthine dehydrogenase family protein subunit M [Candidatus Tectomicrobia bacterium]
MKPAPFFYATPSTVEEAIALLVEHGDEAKLLAGGQSLVPMMNFRLVRPEYLIDLNRLEGLDYITEHDGILAVGAMTRQRSLERSDLIRQHYPLLAEATAVLGHPATRNRGTVGGSIAHADPAAELPALLLTYGGSVIVQGPGGRRQIPAEDFFVTYLTTALEPSDIVVEVQFAPWSAGTGWGFLEESRRHGDFAVVGVTALLTLDANGLCSRVAVTLFGVGGVPTRIESASSLLVGHVPDDDRIAAVAQTMPGQVEPESDIHASADFRRHLNEVLTRRALQQAAERATS